MRRLRWISGIVWAFSWYTIYLEIFRWQHMTKTLRFQAPPPVDGAGAPPRAGLPLKAVCVTSVAAPLAWLAATIAVRASRAAGRRGPSGLPDQDGRALARHRRVSERSLRRLSGRGRAGQRGLKYPPGPPPAGTGPSRPRPPGAPREAAISSSRLLRNGGRVASGLARLRAKDRQGGMGPHAAPGRDRPQRGSTRAW